MRGEVWNGDVHGTHMAPETRSRDTAPLLDHSRRDCDAPEQNAPHLDDLRHPRDSRTDCDSARQRPARPARDRLRLGSRTPTIGRTAYISPRAQFTHTPRALRTSVYGSQTAPRPTISIFIPMQRLLISHTVLPCSSPLGTLFSLPLSVPSAM